EDVDALTVYSDVLIDLERFDDAMAVLDRLIALQSDAVGAMWNKSLICLGRGRFREGWPLYEHRWAAAKGLVPRPYPQPRWNGERVEGPLLIWGEEGLGDETLHGTITPALTAPPPRIVPGAEPRLVPLFARSFPPVRVIPVQAELYAGPILTQEPLGSLG